MAKMVESRQAFQRLVLSKNSIGEAGASAFAVALNAHQGLEELELHKNCLEWGGMEVCKALQNNNKLASLGLSHNTIYIQAGEAIANSIQTCVLRRLEVSM